MRKTQIITTENDLSSVGATQSLNLVGTRTIKSNVTIEMIKDLKEMKSIYGDDMDIERQLIKEERNRKINELLNGD